jgi:glycosyltransferase involved in cell wall biosynthesis
VTQVSVVSPVFNEAGSLPELVARVSRTLDAYVGPQQWEFLLVDDCSSDGSWDAMCQVQADTQGAVRLFRHKRRMGQGGAQQTGLFFARGTVVVTLDADLQLSPEDLPRVAGPVLEGTQDIVATRVVNGRTVISTIGNIFMRLLLQSPVSDASTKFMALRGDYVRRVRMIGNDQRYLLSIAMSRGAARVVEVPIHYTARRFGVSKYSKLRKAFQGIPEMLAVRRRIAAGAYRDTLPDDYPQTALRDAREPHLA